MDAAWQRRLNALTGRTFDPTALTHEQEGRAGRLATRGQGLTTGVVRGLELGLDPLPGAQTLAGGDDFFNIAAGSGIATSGEDVVLNQDVRVNLKQVPIIWLDKPAPFPRRASLRTDGWNAPPLLHGRDHPAADQHG